MDGEQTRVGSSILDSVPVEPFILAYQTVRLRKKSGRVTDKEWGLFDDNDDDSSDPMDEWDVDWYPGGV